MRYTGGISIVLLLVAGSLFTECGGDSDLIDTVATPIAQVVEKIKLSDRYYRQKVTMKANVFYRANEYQRAWLRKGQPDKLFNAFVKEVNESGRYGFDPNDYKTDELEAAVKDLYDDRKRNPEDISALDIRITACYFLFTTHLIEGRVRRPGAKEFLWKREAPLENDIALLIKMKKPADLRKELEDLHPKDPQYARLQTTLQEYIQLTKSDTFPPIPGTLKLKPGQEHDAVPLVRKKLRLTDLTIRGNDTLRAYDDELVRAVQKFQQRHGLDPHGNLDAETVRLLNITISQRADLISLNLERLRWHPHLMGQGDEIVINVPEYMMRVYHNNKKEIEMRVVIGSEYTPTPVFHDSLKYIVFNPTWMVPKSIFLKEFLPTLKENPGHFAPDRFRFYKEGKEIDPSLELWDDEELDSTSYSVVENPGEANSLGKVKFIMPNDFSIYLHDTPANKLFRQEERALSHGCIRLERPIEFAMYLLSDKKEWDEDSINSTMSTDKPVQVDLTRPFPVYIVYRTVWVDDAGAVNFREDIYGHDERHLAHLVKTDNDG